MLAPQSIMFPGLHPMAMMSTGRGFCGAPPPFPPPIYAPLPGQGGAQQGAGDSQVFIGNLRFVLSSHTSTVVCPCHSVDGENCTNY